jgi:hypothetical protein
MIRIEKVKVGGFEEAIRGARNSWDSHNKSDSRYDYVIRNSVNTYTGMGEEDHALLLKLVKAGDSHAKCMRMITVWCDIIAPRYFWTEFDTYHYMVRCSESTMHTITRREIVKEDFSLDAMDMVAEVSAPIFKAIIDALNIMRKKYLFFTGQDPKAQKTWWKRIIKLLPQSYMQKSTICTNYQTLRNMYHQRKGHRLSEWEEFREWCESLPYSELITTPSK